MYTVKSVGYGKLMLTQQFLFYFFCNNNNFNINHQSLDATSSNTQRPRDT